MCVHEISVIIALLPFSSRLDQRSKPLQLNARRLGPGKAFTADKYEISTKRQIIKNKTHRMIVQWRFRTLRTAQQADQNEKNNQHGRHGAVSRD
jgi:hypothetical protein